MHKREERFERVTRALLDEEDSQDAAGAQAWLNNWKYFLELSYSRRVEAANRHRALQEAVTAGKVSRDMVPYALRMKLPKGQNSSPTRCSYALDRTRDSSVGQTCWSC